MPSLRNILQDCLGHSGRISLRQDVLGVYAADNPQDRSTLDQLDRIQNRPFVRIALVVVQPSGGGTGPTPSIQRDLDNANTVYQNECDAWVYPVGLRTVTTNLLGTNGILDQTDCRTVFHFVSDEEDALFDLGRNMGADLVCYYIRGDVGGFRGCAAHPAGRRGFWVGNTASPWTFVHEMTHVIGNNGHVNDTDNLMVSNTGTITNPPPNLTNNQENRVLGDQDVESC
ncbi:MAG: hypothetical protein R3248_14620 [Candidatus Promineifilaceae bacterium]|nr:hypothetical protein [Candidatus Promineifilaceae bacterium]